MSCRGLGEARGGGGWGGSTHIGKGSKRNNTDDGCCKSIPTFAESGVLRETRPSLLVQSLKGLKCASLPNDIRTNDLPVLLPATQLLLSFGTPFSLFVQRGLLDAGESLAGV